MSATSRRDAERHRLRSHGASRGTPGRSLACGRRHRRRDCAAHPSLGVAARIGRGQPVRPLRVRIRRPAARRRCAAVRGGQLAMAFAVGPLRAAGRHDRGVARRRRDRGGTIARTRDDAARGRHRGTGRRHLPGGTGLQPGGALARGIPALGDWRGCSALAAARLAAGRLARDPRAGLADRRVVRERPGGLRAPGCAVGRRLRPRPCIRGSGHSSQRRSLASCNRAARRPRDRARRRAAAVRARAAAGYRGRKRHAGGGRLGGGNRPAAAGRCLAQGPRRVAAVARSRLASWRSRSSIAAIKRR